MTQPPGNPTGPTGPDYTQPLPPQGFPPPGQSGGPQGGPPPGWSPGQQGPGQQWGPGGAGGPMGPGGPGGPGWGSGGPGGPGQQGSQPNRTRLFVILGVVGLLVIGTIITLVFVLGGDDADEDGPVETVQDYIDAIEEGDCDDAREQVVESERDTVDCGDRALPEGVEIGTPKLLEEDGDTAKVDVPLSGPGVPDDFVSTITLTKENGEWLIEDFGASEGSSPEVLTPSAVPSDLMTDMPTDFPTDPSELLSELSDLPTDLLTDLSLPTEGITP